MTNVVPLRPQGPPALQYAEIRLDDETDNLQLCVFDASGDRTVLTYALIDKSPETFSLDLLREAWDRWRHESALAM